MQSILSSVSNIESIAKFDSHGFKQTELLGSFINNNEYSEGFVNFMMNRETADAYMWKCLSAIGEQLGEVSYTNIRNYIDFVSNIDVCKIQSLRSMMKMLGFDYTIFDNIEHIPVEILNLMNVVSISKKYLLKDGLLNSELVDDLFNVAGSGGILSNDEDLSAYFSSDAIQQGDKRIDSRCISDIQYFQYITELYRIMLDGFLHLEFNVDPEHTLESRYYIYEHLNDIDTDFINDIYRFKIRTNIEKTYNQSIEVDKIENGETDLSDYSYPYSELIQMEIDRRTAKATDILNKIKNDSTLTPNEKQKYILSNVSKYTYYRRKKVEEYIDFINNKYFIDNIANLSSIIYKLDPDFINIKSFTLNTDTESSTQMNVVENGQINNDMVYQVAKSLAVATMYIIRLREKLKLQSRKNYMKGTANLLLYIINEYLIDYSRHHLYLSAESVSNPHIQYILAQLSSHSIDELNVLEYFDETEYYNQETKTSNQAVNSQIVNQDFWKQYHLTADDGLTYGLREIQKFYLSSMMMKDVLSSNDDLQNFLDIVFETGANDSFIDKKTGIFSTRLTKYGKYSNEIYPHLSALSAANLNFKKYLAADYKYPLNTIRNQITDVLSNSVFPTLSNNYFQSISAIYDTYHTNVIDLSSRLENIVTAYNKLALEDNQFYLTSSDVEYCLNYSDPDNPFYKHDFYIDNPVYMHGVRYISEKLSRFKDFIYSVGVDVDVNGKNIQNHQLIDMAITLGQKINDISSQYTNQIVRQIQDVIGDSGFVDIQAPYMEDELNHGYEYLNQRTTNRLDYLKGILNEIRSQASQLNSKYNNIESTFAQVVAQYNDENSYYQLGSDQIYSFSQFEVSKAGWKRDTTPQKTSKGREQYYVKELGMYYYQVESGSGNFEGTLQTVNPVYNPSGSLINRIHAVIAYMNVPTSYTQNNNVYGLKQDGSYAAVQQCESQYNELVGELNTIADRVKSIGGTYDSSGFKNLPLKDQIDKLIDYLTAFDEKIFENDTILAGSKRLLKLVTQFSSDFTQIKLAYQDFMKIRSQQDYLRDFTSGNQLTIFELNRMLKYQQTTDEKNKKIIIGKYEELYNLLRDLEKDIYILAENIIQNISNNYLYIGVAELDLEALEKALFTDIETRFYQQDIRFENEKIYIQNYLDIISSEISDKIDTMQNLDEAISERLDFLNFFNDKQYIDQKEMFQQYTGLSGISRYPYYSQSNVTHPSYQIHPFLWNFVLRDKYDMNSIVRSFYSIQIDELEDANIKNNFYKYYDEFGNSVNAWMRNVLDYSGYTTGYEDSQHYSIRSTAKSELIGYDGIFYPVAVEMIMEDYNSCLASLSDCIDLNAISSAMVLNSHGIFIDYIDYVDVTNDLDSKIGIQCTGYSKLLDFVKKYTIKYFINSIDYDEIINKYLQLHTSNGLLDQSLTIRNFIAFFISQLNETFYGRFYRHIGFEKNGEYHKFIVDQFIEYYPEIIEIAAKQKYEKDVFDIYKYCKDSRGNQFILIKTYNQENPTYHQKQNTPGRLWIRPCEFPLAFPAFSGKHPCMLTYPASQTQSWINLLAGRLDTDTGTFIDDKMEYFYDMDIVQNKNNLFLVSMIKDIPNNFTSTDEFVQQYQNPWILNIPITILHPITYQFITQNQTINLSSQQDNAIDSGWDIMSNPRLSCVPSTYVDNYAYIGMYHYSSNQINFVYVLKRYTSKKNISLLGSVRIIPFANGRIDRNSIIDFQINVNDAVTDEIVFQYDSNQVLTFAYLTENKYGTAYSGKTSGYVDLDSNTEGIPFGDPRVSEMTSHDIFKNNVKFVKYRISGQKNAFKIINTEMTSNINADMSYIPVYPGLSGEANLLNTASDDGYIRIQLMGKSKNIDYRIAATNISVDPYFDYGRISTDYIFGRVYEDFDQKYDRSLQIFVNPSINDNINTETVNATQECFIWTVTEFNSIDYTDHDIDNLKIACYNINTLGKNPYIVSELKNFRGDKWIELSSYEKTDSNRFAETVLTGIDSMSNKSFINITGTYTGDDQQNFTDCNHLQNISGIFIKLDDKTKKLEFKFMLENPELSGQTFILNESIRVIVYNINDLRKFNHYHYMDVYGAVNMKDTTIDIPEDIIRNDVSFIYDRNMYEKINLTRALRSYYDRKIGIEEYTQDIDLSEYDYLSDVYILQTSKRLNFMYDEEDVFKFGVPGYYFPTFNTAYPKNMGQSFDSMVETMFGVNTMKDMFSEENIFIIDLLSATNIADNIGDMDIPVEIEEEESYRIFESETEFEDGEYPVSSFYENYDPADARSIGYMHVFEEDGAHIDNADQINDILVSDNLTESVNNKLHDLDCAIKSSMVVKNQNNNLKVYFNMTSKNADLSKFLKLYVNYKKDNTGIHLYFNYFNYLNTPFIEIKNNKIYPVILPSTYLHLKPGESGFISFIIQFKYIIEKGIYGCRNVELARYSVFNVSDDKPKFVLKLAKTVSFGDGSSSNGAPTVRITAGNAKLKINTDDILKQNQFDIPINIVVANGELSSGYKIGLNYMPEIMKPNEKQTLTGITIDNSQRDSGYIELTIDNTSVQSFKIKMSIANLNINNFQYIGKYPIEIETPESILGVNGIQAIVETTYGYLTIEQ